VTRKERDWILMQSRRNLGNRKLKERSDRKGGLIPIINL
jgi:hypothetical protein